MRSIRGSSPCGPDQLPQRFLHPLREHSLLHGRLRDRHVATHGGSSFDLVRIAHHAPTRSGGAEGTAVTSKFYGPGTTSRRPPAAAPPREGAAARPPRTVAAEDRLKRARSAATPVIARRGEAGVAPCSLPRVRRTQPAPRTCSLWWETRAGGFGGAQPAVIVSARPAAATALGVRVMVERAARLGALHVLGPCDGRRAAPGKSAGTRVGRRAGPRTSRLEARFEHRSARIGQPGDGARGPRGQSAGRGGQVGGRSDHALGVADG